MNGCSTTLMGKELFLPSGQMLDVQQLALRRKMYCCTIIVNFHGVNILIMASS